MKLRKPNCINSVSFGCDCPAKVAMLWVYLFWFFFTFRKRISFLNKCLFRPKEWTLYWRASFIHLPILLSLSLFHIPQGTSLPCTNCLLFSRVKKTSYCSMVVTVFQEDSRGLTLVDESKQPIFYWVVSRQLYADMLLHFNYSPLVSLHNKGTFYSISTFKLRIEPVGNFQ